MRFNTIFIILLLSGCLTAPQEQDNVVVSDEESLNQRSLSRQQCQSMGGKEIGDIGDGRIHRPGYLCQNNKRPLGSIIADQGQPIAIEGSVCCGTVEDRP